MKTTAFKNTDIGPIPEDWEMKKLGAFGSFRKGHGISREESHSGTIPAIRYGELYTTHHDIIRKCTSFISKQVSSSALLIQRGDVLFACSGETKEEIGKCAAFIDDFVAYAGGDLLVFTPCGQFDSRFLGYALNAPICASQKSAAGQGDAVVHIREEALIDISIAVPPLPEQRRIAAALLDADELVASLDKLIEKKKRVKEGAMQRLLSGETRLPGFTGKWVEKPVSDSLQSVGALNAPVKWRELQTPEEGSFPAFSASGQDVWTRNPIFHEDGIVVSAIGSRCGKAFLARGDWGVVANTHVILARNGACIPFWFYILNNEEWWIKAGTGQPYVLIRASLARTMTTPEPDEQRAIATVLSDMDAEIAALSRERAEAARIKQGMMQELLTGKVRLEA